MIYNKKKSVKNKMDIRDKSRNCKSRDAILKTKDAKNKIRELVNKLKNNKYFFQEITDFIITLFTEKNFCSIGINEIVDSLKKTKKFGNNPNPRNDVVNLLKNNLTFPRSKNRYKYDINLEKAISYLSSFSNVSFKSNSLSGNSRSNSNKTKKSDSSLEKSNNRPSPVFNFPECQNEVVYLNLNNEGVQQRMSCSFDDEYNFTFGEQSQIKAIHNKLDDDEPLMDFSVDEARKINRINLSEEQYNILVAKVEENKRIPEYESIFDKNNYLKNLQKNVEEFFKLFQSKDENMAENSKLETEINKIYSLIKDLEIKINSFNESSSLFNEKKEELIYWRNAIHRQYQLIKYILKEESIEEQLITKEKEIFNLYIEGFKNLTLELPKNYEEAKLIEKKIKEIICDIKVALNVVCGVLLENIKEEYKDFYEMAKNIVNEKYVSYKVDINETMKLFCCDINDFQKYLLEIQGCK